ncbi:MAG: hypothetical protein Q4A06_04890 [Cardiobacteriaceae bacterium]|nr:hypothetical protein [Cardiobacteriaceae bacterium]
MIQIKPPDAGEKRGTHKYFLTQAVTAKTSSLRRKFASLKRYSSGGRIVMLSREDYKSVLMIFLEGFVICDCFLSSRNVCRGKK